MADKSRLIALLREAERFLLCEAAAQGEARVAMQSRAMGRLLQCVGLVLEMANNSFVRRLLRHKEGGKSQGVGPYLLILQSGSLL
jgi:hypothetical protein